MPSRYTATGLDLAAGRPVRGHYSLQGSTPDHTTDRVYQLGRNPRRTAVRLFGIGKPPTGAVISKKVYYHLGYFNYDYGMGKIYFAFVRSNNNGTTGTAPNVLFNGGSPLGNTGALITGTDPGALTEYDIPQISADYQINKQWRIGGLYGKIKDKSGTGKNASGWSVSTYYDVFKDTMMYFLVNSLDNEPNELGDRLRQRRVCASLQGRLRISAPAVKRSTASSR